MEADGKAESLRSYLDAALLKPEMTADEVREGLSLCAEYKVATACVRPSDIALAQAVLAGTGVGVCVVLAFPHGAQLSSSKADEARRYAELGVAEVDMVGNIGLARAGDWGAYAADVAAVAEVLRPAGIPLKVIGETALLDSETIRGFVEASVDGGADYVKTSTGFASGGASVEAVQGMLEAARGRVAVKASGGIRDAATGWRYVRMGVKRLGVGVGSVAALCDEGAGETTVGEGY